MESPFLSWLYNETREGHARFDSGLQLIVADITSVDEYRAHLADEYGYEEPLEAAFAYTQGLPSLVEVRPPDGACSCASPGRTDLAARSTREAIESELAFTGYCEGETGIACSDYCLCELEELSGGALDVCRNDPTDSGMLSGFCYVDPDAGFGNPELVSGCAPTQRRILRFMGEDLPASNAQTFVACTDG